MVVRTVDDVVGRINVRDVLRDGVREDFRRRERTEVSEQTKLQRARAFDSLRDNFTDAVRVGFLGRTACSDRDWTFRRIDSFFDKCNAFKSSSPFS